MDKEIFSEAFDRCMEELYNKSYPKASWKEYVEKFERGELGKDDRIYERHYLSYEEYTYILDKYVKMYGLEKKWVDNCNIIIDDLKNGYSSDDVVPSYIDEDGNHHSSMRTYKHVNSIVEQFKEILSKHGINTSKDLADDLTECVINNIENRRDFYRFDRNEDDFRCSIALGASPTSNYETVKKYWADQGLSLMKDPPFKNPLLLWEIDEYGDQFEEIMKEDYGDNWKEIWDKRWEEKVEQEKKEREAKLKELKEKYKNNN